MTAPKARPILFSAPMVLAILEGRKTQTRRIVKLPTIDWDPSNTLKWEDPECFHSLENCDDFVACFSDTAGSIICVKCPYGTPAYPVFRRPADRLWVRETYAAPHNCDHLKPREIPEGARIHYAATEERGGLRWRPSIFMPRWASRITLEIAAVRVERLQDISEDDARAEGCDPVVHPDGALDCGTRKTTFASLWSTINGPESWDANPWVWVVEFHRSSQPTGEAMANV